MPPTCAAAGADVPIAVTVDPASRAANSARLITFFMAFTPSSGRGFEIGEEIGGPVESAVAEPEFGEIGMAARLDQLADLDLVGSRGGGGKGERHIAKAEFEQSIAAPRLAIIVALRGRPAQYLDLAIVEPERSLMRAIFRSAAGSLGRKMRGGPLLTVGGAMRQPSISA